MKRRFALENIDLIKKAPAKTSGDGDDDLDAPQTGSKRARTQGGRITNGEDFWGKVDAFFVSMIEVRGRNLTGSSWKE